MPSCSSRLSLAAGPISPKPALLTTIGGVEPARGQLRGDAPDSIPPLEIDAQHRRRRAARGGDLVGERGEPLLPPRHQNQLMAVRGEDTRQRRADARRRAGDQRDRLHEASPPCVAPCAASAPMRWRSSIRSRCDTPSRSAARQRRLSSSSSRLPSA